MIRLMQEPDLPEIMQIWLEENLHTHHYIAADYWRSHFEAAREAISQAEIWIYTEENLLLGFLGMHDSMIQGLFVRSAHQGKGIGKKLLDAVKGRYSQLTLQVYEKNDRAISFYQREGFRLMKEQMEQITGQVEWQMQWEK